MAKVRHLTIMLEKITEKLASSEKDRYAFVCKRDKLAKSDNRPIIVCLKGNVGKLSFSHDLLNKVPLERRHCEERVEEINSRK